MSMPPGQRPGGSRPQRPPYGHPGHPGHPGQPGQMARPSSRNAAFENIFGRPAGGHHLGGGGGGGAPGPHGQPHVQRSPFPGAPAYPPQNPAQPSFPPTQTPTPFPHPGAPKPHGGAPNPYSNYPAEAYRAPAQQGFDGANGGVYANMRGPSYNVSGTEPPPPQPQPSCLAGAQTVRSWRYGDDPSARSVTDLAPQPQIQQLQSADAVPNRRTSLNPQSTQSGRQYLQRAPTQTSYNSYSSPGERLPQVNERLPHISVIPNGGGGGGPPVATALQAQKTGGSIVMPHPRSMSGSAATGLQPMPQASVPPRSRSLHHQGGRPQPQSSQSGDSSRIRVNIPSPTISGGGIMPFPEIPSDSSISGHTGYEQESPDFSRAMSDLSLNNGNGSVHATTSETSLYPESISGLPRDRRSDHYLRAWDGNQEPQERLHDINREYQLWCVGVTPVRFSSSLLTPRFSFATSFCSRFQNVDASTSAFGFFDCQQRVHRQRTDGVSNLELSSIPRLNESCTMDRSHHGGDQNTTDAFHGRAAAARGGTCLRLLFSFIARAPSFTPWPLCHRHTSTPQS